MAARLRCARFCPQIPSRDRCYLPMVRPFAVRNWCRDTACRTPSLYCLGDPTGSVSPTSPEPAQCGRCAVQSTVPLQSRARLPRPALRRRLRARPCPHAPSRLTPDPRGAETQREAAEAPDLDAPAVGEMLRHVIEHHLHRELDVALDELGLVLRDAMDQLALRHRPIVACAPRGRDRWRRRVRAAAVHREPSPNLDRRGR